MIEDQLERYSPRVLDRARSSLKRRKVRQDAEQKTVFWVESADGKRTYRTQLLSDVFMMCSCTNGRNTGGEPLCWHTAAVLLWIQLARQKRKG